MAGAAELDLSEMTRATVDPLLLPSLKHNGLEKYIDNESLVHHTLIMRDWCSIHKPLSVRTRDEKKIHC